MTETYITNPQSATQPSPRKLEMKRAVDRQRDVHRFFEKIYEANPAGTLEEGSWEPASSGHTFVHVGSTTVSVPSRHGLGKFVQLAKKKLVPLAQETTPDFAGTRDIYIGYTTRWGLDESETAEALAREARRSNLRHAFPPDYWGSEDDEPRIESRASRLLEHTIPDIVPPDPGESAREKNERFARSRRKRLEALDEE